MLSEPPTELTREQRRSRRKREVRARTISIKRMTQRELAIGRTLYPETDYWKPRTRGECIDGPRPCPYVSCKFNLYIDVNRKTGAIKLVFPDLEVDELEHSGCALDEADRGGLPPEHVGEIMNFTRERCRQIETRALAKLELAGAAALRELAELETDEEPGAGRRSLPVLELVRDVDRSLGLPDEALDLPEMRVPA